MPSVAMAWIATHLAAACIGFFVAGLLGISKCAELEKENGWLRAELNKRTTRIHQLLKKYREGK